MIFDKAKLKTKNFPKKDVMKAKSSIAYIENTIIFLYDF